MDDERNEQLSQRPPAEGVRIIKAEEAQAALDAGQAAGRQPDDAPRFGDVPPQPSGPRSPHRFPLPDSVDPASALRRPPVRTDDRWAASRTTAASGGQQPAQPAEQGEPRLPAGEAGQWAPPGDTATAGSATASARPPDGVGSTPEPTPDLAPPKEGITLESSAGPELPHWTDPPTGEVPRILPDAGVPAEDDMSAWQALGARGLRWRDGASDWDDLEDVSTLGDDEPRLGALDTTRTEHSDMFSFDEQFERLEEERSGPHPAFDPGFDETPAPPRQSRTARSRPPRKPTRRPPRPPSGGPAGGGRDLQSAAAVGIGLLILALIAYAIGPLVFMLLATVVVTASVLELYNLIQHRGFRPATLLGVCATIAVMLAAYWRGEEALPLVLALVFVTSMLWYMLEVVEARPVVNVALTVMAFVWVGVFGSYASLLLRAHDGKKILLLPVLATVAADVIAYFAGSAFGSRPLAPNTSPGKTWEGTLLGGVAAIVVSVIIGKGLLSHTWTFKHAFLLGLMVAIVAPLGDLCESMVKRDLHLKDSGTALPGHGGLLDRFDALLFVLPATYYLSQYLRLH